MISKVENEVFVDVMEVQFSVGSEGLQMMKERLVLLGCIDTCSVQLLDSLLNEVNDVGPLNDGFVGRKRLFEILQFGLNQIVDVKVIWVVRFDPSF